MLFEYTYIQPTYMAVCDLHVTQEFSEAYLIQQSHYIQHPELPRKHLIPQESLEMSLFQ